MHVARRFGLMGGSCGGSIGAPVGKLFSILAVAMVYVMTPGASELAENVVHLVTHGDSAHSDEHSGETESDEHGCSGPYHACVCHHTSSFVTVAVRANVAAAISVNVPTPGDATWGLDSGYVAEVDRPPQA